MSKQFAAVEDPADLATGTNNHLLFPRICHIHYPALSRIVEAVCREFGVRYSAHRSLAAGIASHFRWLRRLGRPQPTPA